MANRSVREILAAKGFLKETPELIDEADVYIKRRDDNMTMNAVVGVFLRVLEYFNGLLFLTTSPWVMP